MTIAVQVLIYVGSLIVCAASMLLVKEEKPVPEDSEQKQRAPRVVKHYVHGYYRSA